MRKKSYSRPVSDISGHRTFVTETSAKNLPAPTAKPSKDNLRYENPENKERALPASESEAENKVRYIGQPSFSKPDETNDTVVNPRTLGKPGEDYGHPVIGPTRHPGRRPIQAKFKYFPKKTQRQHEQKRKARRYSRRWYRRRKSKHKRINRINYKQKKRNPQFKRKRRFYNSTKYNTKYKRLPYGGVRTQAERSKNWSKEYRRKNKQKMKRYRKKYKQNPNQHKRQGLSRYRRLPKTASSLFVFGMDLPMGFRFGFVKDILIDNWSVILHVQGFGKQTIDINSFLNHAIFCDNSEGRFFALLEKNLEDEAQKIC